MTQQNKVDMASGETTSPHGLDRELCLSRQDALRRDIREAGCSALLIRGRGQLSRLFNYHAREVFPAAALILADGPSILSRKQGDECIAFADEVRDYEAARMDSLRPNLADIALEPLLQLVSANAALGTDGDLPLSLLRRFHWTDMRSRIDARRRSKDSDEVALIEAAAAAGEAAYDAIAPLLVDGAREIDIFAAYQAAAVVAAGDQIGELGNDFRGGAPGGSPRTAPLKAGDLIPIDTGVMLRGYYSDLCRTYPVGGEWAARQLDAARRVAAAHDLATSMIAPGVPCRGVHAEVSRFLDGYNGWSFKSHLGHGIGINPVETPRINPNWDDHFEIGDVFTLEPGLYSPELRSGIRIENDYVLLETGLRRLSNSGGIIPA